METESVLLLFSNLGKEVLVNFRKPIAFWVILFFLLLNVFKDKGNISRNEVNYEVTLNFRKLFFHIK